MLESLKKTPGRIEVITLIDAHLAECPCECVKALQLAICKEIVKESAPGDTA